MNEFYHVALMAFSLERDGRFYSKAVHILTMWGTNWFCIQIIATYICHTHSMLVFYA